MVNVSSVLLIGDHCDYLLFKVAFHYAEAGNNVWFVSPQLFNKVPANIIPPDKEVLQLITFLYLKDHKDLITHLNGIHLWHKTPSVIIVKGFEDYTNLSSDNYSSLRAAFTVTTLLDSLATCSRKTDAKTFLIMACVELLDCYIQRLKLLVNLYDLKHITRIEDSITFEEIVNYFTE